MSTTKYQTKIKKHIDAKYPDGITLKELETKTGIPYTRIRSPLASLLNKEIIKISGFKKDTKFSLNNIQFTKRLPHETSTDILVLLNASYDGGGKKAKDAREELKEKFRKKFRQYEKKEDAFYNSLLPRVKSLPAIEEYNREKEYLHKIAQGEYEAKKLQFNGKVNPKAKPGEEWKSTSIPELKKYRLKLYNLHLYFNPSKLTEKSKVWMVSNLTEEEAWKITIKKYSKSNFYRGTIWDMKENTLKDRWREIGSLNMEWVDVEGDGTPESYLKKWNFNPKRSEEYIDDLFDDVLFFIDTHENRKRLIYHFSFALSDERDSITWFERFISYVLNEPFNLKFQKDLGVKEPKSFL